MKLVLASCVIILGAGVACATVQLPAEQLASSEAAIRSADELGAPSVPAAALHLRLAEEEMTRAKALAYQGDGERADLYLRRSSADAELALALVREAKARGEADRAQTDANNLERSTR